MSNANCKARARPSAVPFAAGRGPAHAALFALTRGVGLVLTWQERSRERRHLAELPDHVLRDVGLSRADVAHEAAKPFWTA
jgi:uncharacterized protein YjiS (DUF1127 family)